VRVTFASWVIPMLADNEVIRAEGKKEPHEIESEKIIRNPSDRLDINGKKEKQFRCRHDAGAIQSVKKVSNRSAAQTQRPFLR